MRPIIQSKKRNASGRKIFFALAIGILALFSISQNSFFRVSSFFNATAVPFWHTKENLSALSNSAPILRSRTALSKENDDLRAQIDTLTRNLKGYDAVVQENLEFKKLFAGKKEEGIFAGVLAHPGSLPFDTFLADAGSEAGIKNGWFVLVDQNIAIGTVIETYPSSVKIKAFSSSGETTDVFLGPENISAQLKGAGGGSYTVELPRDLDVREGDAAALPGADGFIVGYVESKEENTTDSFQKIYLRSPVNVFELKYVQIIPHLLDVHE